MAMASAPTDPIAPRLDQLEPILVDLNVAAPVALAELKGGTPPVFRVDLADGTALVLKTYDERTSKLPARENYASRLLGRLNVPVTRYLAMDEACTRLPFRYAITTYLPGATAGDLKDEPDIADAHRQMGALLRQLHSVQLPAYGHFDENGIISPVTASGSWIHGVAAHAFEQFAQHGGDDTLKRHLQAIVEEGMDILSHSTGPVFAHDDLHPNNVLFERDAEGRLRLSGLLDFGNSRAADAVFDLAKTLFICEHEAPGASAAIREGYGLVAHPDPERAIWLHTLLHRVVMWWWLRHVGVIADGEEHGLMTDLRTMAARG